MYNRYIPQPDGSYQRNRQQDSFNENRPIPPPQENTKTTSQPSRTARTQTYAHSNVLGFLHRLLPREIDTADLIIVLLLLLMAEDREENRNTALLTLALYFFL